MRTLWLIAKIIFFTIVGLVCALMVGYAAVDMYVILRQVTVTN